MAKTLSGKVVAVNDKTITIEVVRKTPHPLYKKLMTRSKKFKVDTNGQEVTVGDVVVASETKPISKDKFFIVTTVVSRVKEAKHE